MPRLAGPGKEECDSAIAMWPLRSAGRHADASPALIRAAVHSIIQAR